VALIASSLALGCAEAKPKTDTAKPMDTTGQENLEPAPPPVPEPSRLGQMPLLRGAPTDGKCDSTRNSTEKRIILEGDAPLRTLTVGVPLREGRAFVPLYLDVKSKQARGDGVEENETIYVGFTETGGLDMGRRQYYVTNTAPKDAGPVSSDDVESAKQLALQVLQRCRGS
jgi:hypothetical protein